jgi:integrase/recombinase XerD
MTILAVPAAAVGSLRQRLTDDMTLRRFSRETQRNDIRDVGRLATFLRRSPDTATVDWPAPIRWPRFEVSALSVA